MKLRSIITLSLLASLMLSFKIDETPLEKLLKHIAKITSTYPQEKVHLHTDKPYYAFGEDIWIKAYVVTAEKNQPSFLSGVLHVDLINAANEIVKNVRLKIDSGFANGNISLTDSLPSGNYKIRSYTNYMRNYASNFFFEKPIQIVNVFEQKKENPLPVDKAGIAVQFFPEGGDLVEGLRSKVGVKAVGKNGLGVKVSGYIANRNNEKVAEFTTEHAGLGVFAFTPKASEKYTATITSPADNKSFNLPIVKPTGFVLAVNDIDTSISLKITGSQSLVDGKEIFVIAQSNGIVYGSYKYKFDNAAIVISISKNDFPSGIIHFTLFNSLSEPVAERLVFVQHNDQLKIALRSPDSIGKTKGKTNLSLRVLDFNAKPVKGNFSIAVTDVGKVPFNDDDETTILSNLLLTSDLKGYIEQPNYYFNNPNDDKKRQLNTLLLTQGWRRFKWEEIKAEKEPDLSYRIEQSLEITGTITTLNDKPIPNARVILYSNTKSFVLMLDTVSDAKGRFVFDRLDIPDSVSLFLQAKNVKGNPNVKLRLDDGPLVESTAIITSQVDLENYVNNTKALFDDYEKSNLGDKIIKLRAVNIVSNKSTNPMAIAVQGSQNISGRDYVIGRDKLKTEINLLDMFYKVPGVRVIGTRVYKASMRGVSITSDPPPMMVFLNGQLVDSDIIISLTADDVEGIEVLTSNSNLSVYGTNAMWGILHITMRKGRDIQSAPSTNIKLIKDRSFAFKKEFYMPNYDDPKVNKSTADLRTTIYWNANINTNDSGNATINFFNAGSAGTYKVIIEGMDAFGNLGRKTYNYVVK